MSEFGLPARTATSDANAGLVNAPSVKEGARTAVSQNVRATSDLDQGVQALGSSLGNAFTKVLRNKAEYINAQRQLDAAARQGTEKAINSIDEEKRRTGWTKHVFGENIEYRAAQQRAVGNSVQQTYLEEANKIPERAAETPEQYQQRLSQALTKQLEQYPNDLETQRLITANWTKATEQLTKSQAKEHFGFNQTQQRETTRQSIEGTFDTFLTESTKISSEAEATEFTQKAKQFFSGAGKPEGMDQVAYRGLMNESIEKSLAEGNIGVYNMANAHGWFDDLNKQERAKLDVAISKYDTKSGYKISLSVSEAQLAAKKAKTVDDVLSIISETEEAITAHGGRTSGTDRYDLNISKAKQSLQNLIPKAVEAAAIDTSKQDRLEEVIAAQNLSIQGDASTLATLNVTKKEATAAAAERERRLIGGIVGDEDITQDDAIRAAFADPTLVGSKVVQVWGDDQADSGMVKVMGQSYVSGFSGPSMVDENHQPTELARNAMNLFSQFENEDKAKFRKQLGEDNYDEYLIIKDGQLSGKTSDMIANEIQAFHDAKGSQDLWATDWSGITGDGVSKRDYVSSLVLGHTNTAPTGVDVGRHMETYRKGLVHGKGDHGIAKDYLFDSLKNKSENYRGQVIHNADRINSKLENHTLPLLLEGIQDRDVNLMTGVIALGLGRTEDEAGNPIRTLDNAAIRGDVKFEVAADGGLWVQSHKFQHDVYLSTEMLQTFSKKLTQVENERKLGKQIKEETFIKQQLASQGARKPRF